MPAQTSNAAPPRWSYNGGSDYWLRERECPWPRSAIFSTISLTYRATGRRFPTPSRAWSSPLTPSSARSSTLLTTRRSPSPTPTAACAPLPTTPRSVPAASTSAPPRPSRCTSSPSSSTTTAASAACARPSARRRPFPRVGTCRARSTTRSPAWPAPTSSATSPALAPSSASPRATRWFSLAWETSPATCGSRCSPTTTTSASTYPWASATAARPPRARPRTWTPSVPPRSGPRRPWALRLISAR